MFYRKVNTNGQCTYRETQLERVYRTNCTTKKAISFLLVSSPKLNTRFESQIVVPIFFVIFLYDQCKKCEREDTYMPATWYFLAMTRVTSLHLRDQ